MCIIIPNFAATGQTIAQI